MKEGILDIRNTKQLNNLDNLFKDNDAKAGDKNVVSINNNIKDFNGAKNKIKDNYINRIKSIYNEKIKRGTLNLTDFILWGAAFISFFELIYSIISIIMLAINPETNNNDSDKQLAGMLLRMALPFITLIFFPLIYKFLPKKYFEVFINTNKIKNKEKKIIDNIEYFLPMSKERLNFITKNNIDLRNYIINNPQLCHSQYSIDKALGKKCAFEDYLDNDIKDLFDSTYSFSLELNDVDTSTLNQTLSLEQSNLLPIDENDINMKKFKVKYAIDFGPEKSIIFKHTHEDRIEFESYINSFVENNYNRKCSILSVEEIQ